MLLLIIGHVSVGVFGFKIASGSSRLAGLSMLAAKDIVHLRPWKIIVIKCIECGFDMK